MNIWKNQKSQQKKCTKCSTALHPLNSNLYDIDRGKYICHRCLKKKNEARYVAKKEDIKKRQHEYDLRCRLLVIECYGGICACCNETEAKFLTIDYINGNGLEKRKTTNQGTGGNFYRWLIKNEYPKNDYQLLCHNCSESKKLFGCCPHKELFSHD